MKTASRAQASLEYLTLLAVFVFFFSLSIPMFQRAAAISMFAVETINARNFSEALEGNANKINFLADGSTLFIEAKPIGFWVIKPSGDSVSVTIRNDVLGQEKSFLIETPIILNGGEKLVKGNSFFVLRKENGRILLEDK